MNNEARFLARPTCKHCLGLGVIVYHDRDEPENCRCVNRAVFNTVWDHYMEIVEGDRRASVMYCHQSYGCSRPSEEFLADVRLVARRAMVNERLREILNRWFFGIGSQYSFCPAVRQRLMFKYDIRDASWRADVDSIKILAGAAFEQERPHAIYPVREYLHEHHLADNTPFAVSPVNTSRGPLRAPIFNPSPNRGKKAA